MNYMVYAYNLANGSNVHTMTGDVATLVHAGFSPWRVQDAKLIEEKNCIESFTFKIYPNNPAYQAFVEFQTVITISEVYGINEEAQSFGVVTSWYAGGAITTLICPSDTYVTGETLELSFTAVEVSVSNHNLDLGEGYSYEFNRIFDGRVLMVEENLDASGAVYRKVTCEGVAGYLQDSVQPYRQTETWLDSTTASGLKMYLSELLNTHNDHVDPQTHKYVDIGTVDKTTHLTNNQVTKGTNWQTTWQVLQEKLIDVFGGELRVYRANDNDTSLTLDYKDTLGEEKTDNKIRLTENLKSMTVTPDYSSIITVLYPLGAYKTRTVYDGDYVYEEQDEERIGIEDVNGTEYILDSDAYAKYGVIEGVQIWDDVTLPENLLTKAKAWLAENNDVQVSITLDAYDLALAAEHESVFKLYDFYHVAAEALGIDGMFEIVKKTTDINSPWLSTYEFGKRTITGTAASIGSVQDSGRVGATIKDVSYTSYVRDNKLYLRRKLERS